ncbi:1-deoxyxylulose-5-phosphate synthase YajO-like [Saccoglossus kowalevskii]|uniref:Sterigmatocystin biosynthesis dehydrogenase stcV-like n=1 Tax=Saccoglossus kowalevskii TaxID=10224 RepID=A0ABM0MUE2_SACKO|nr:PREDICTED: putative sterigmatocystin biosynthesis dehydrogenase stcV-like [Saccoglossus kowalevskii]
MTECSMRYNYLGNSGLKVSNICLGTLTFGESERGRPGQANEELSHQLMDRFVEKGGNYIDTANNYQLGLSEKIVGSWLKKRQNRESLVIATKARMAMNFDDPNGIGLSRKHILWTVEESLKRLQTDYIDLYQMHIWDAATPIEESLRTMDDLVRSGKVRYVGVSNFTGWQLQKTADVCKYMGLQKVVSLQAQYSLLVRGLEYELVDVCKNEGIGILPWSPLKGGWLTGKARHGVPPPRGSRMSFVEADRRREYESHPSYSCFADDPQVNDILDKVDRIAKEQGKTMAQVSLRWLLQKDTVPSVVIGAKTLQQLNENMGASSGWELNDSQSHAGCTPTGRPVEERVTANCNSPSRDFTRNMYVD